MDRLGLTWLPRYTARPTGNNQFIELTVTDSDPERAQRVANALAEELILASPGGSQDRNLIRQQFVDSQIEIIQGQILQTEDDIAKKQVEMGNLVSASDLATAQEDLRAMEQKLSILRTNYANLIASSQSVVTNTLQIIEPAMLPTEPVGLGKNVIIALAGVIGLALSLAAAYLIEFLDMTIKTPDDVKRVLNLNSVGFLMDLGKKFDTQAFVYEHPNSQLAESYRSLRVNLEYSQKEIHLKTFLVTSPSPGDGKSTVAINLALSMAQNGRRVILVDTDLRRPSIHRYLGLDGATGVMDVLANPTLFDDDVLQTYKDTELKILPAGEIVGDQHIDHLLTPDKVRQFVTALRDRADIVVFDCSPFLISDAMALASEVDGVILVMRPGVTPKEMAINLVEEFRNTGARLLGVVLNRIPINQAGFGDYYRYHSPYYYNYYKKPENGRLKKA
jgi:non-specific protein-tyrosine kinase